MNAATDRRHRWGQTLLGAQAQFAWRCLLLALMLLVCFLAFDPTPRGPAIGHEDKLLHLLAFVPLSFSACWAVAAGRDHGAVWTPFAWAGLAMLAFGVFIEVVQAFVPARSASLGDVVADGLGITLGLLLAVLAHRAFRVGTPTTEH